MSEVGRVILWLNIDELVSVETSITSSAVQLVEFNSAATLAEEDELATTGTGDVSTPEFSEFAELSLAFTVV